MADPLVASKAGLLVAEQAEMLVLLKDVIWAGLRVA